jgi:hypothetical protein
MLAPGIFLEFLIRLEGEYFLLVVQQLQELKQD